jgi:hypothetical protein
MQEHTALFHGKRLLQPESVSQKVLSYYEQIFVKNPAALFLGE